MKCLIGILGPVKAVRAVNLILRVQVVIYAAKYGGIALLVDERKGLVGVLEGSRKGRVQKEIFEGHPLAIGAGVNHRIRCGSSVKDGVLRARSADGGAEILAGKILSNSFARGEEK